MMGSPPPLPHALNPVIRCRDTKPIAFGWPKTVTLLHEKYYSYRLRLYLPVSEIDPDLCVYGSANSASSDRTPTLLFMSKYISEIILGMIYLCVDICLLTYPTYTMFTLSILQPPPSIFHLVNFPHAASSYMRSENKVKICMRVCVYELNIMALK